MNSPHSTPRCRQEILADINAIKNVVEGTLTLTHQKTANNGQQRPHYHLQKWKNGRNNTVYVPIDKVQDVKKGIENRKQLEALMQELLATDTLAVLATQTPNTSNPGAPVKKNG